MFVYFGYNVKTIKGIDLLILLLLEVSLGIGGITQHNYDKNNDVIRQAIADTLGVTAGEILVDDVEYRTDGVMFNVYHGKDVFVPKNINELVETNLKNIVELSDVSVFDFSNFRSFHIWFKYV